MDYLSISRATLICVYLIGASTSTAQKGDCSVIANADDRLACYDKKDEPAKADIVGGIRGSITWQYNKHVGTRGDNGATIFLLRAPVGNTFASLESYQRKMLAFGIAPTEQPGILYAIEVDGFGRFERDDIEPGEYLTVVLSENTRPGPKDTYTNDCIERLEKYIDELKFFEKSYCRMISIESNKILSFSHDFGNTYF